MRLDIRGILLVITGKAEGGEGPAPVIGRGGPQTRALRLEEITLDKLHEFTGPGIRVTWSRARCIHFAACVRGLPVVFQPGERPWVKLEGAHAAEVAEVVMRCPTGALHFEPLDGAPAEAPSDRNTIQVSSGGPLYARGRLRILSEAGGTMLEDVRAALCRCGGSRNKPFCDGSHFRLGFHDRGEVFAGPLEPGPPPGDGLEITPLDGGPLEVRGPVTISSADGRVSLSGAACKLCRCGGSRNKPFCDGTHLSLGGRAPAM